MGLRNEACEQLLKMRVTHKLTQRTSRGILDKLTITYPKAREGAEPTSEVCIPESVLRLRELGAQTRTVKMTGRAGREEQRRMEEERDRSGVVRKPNIKDTQWEMGG